MTNWDLLRNASLAYMLESSNVIQHFDKLKKKSHDYINDTKEFEKIQCILISKTPKKIKELLQYFKDYLYKKQSIGNIIFSGVINGKLNTFPLILGMKQDVCYHYSHST